MSARMMLYYFRSGAKPALGGFTDDRSGSKLPSEEGPWSFLREVDPAVGWTAAAEIEAVRAGVQMNGFFLVDAPGEITFDEPPVKPGD
jgi:hypothetical protein